VKLYIWQVTACYSQYIYIQIFVKYLYLSLSNKGFATLHTVTIRKIFLMAILFLPHCLVCWVRGSFLNVFFNYCRIYHKLM